jgi:Na+-driven multidrug efflux pump
MTALGTANFALHFAGSMLNTILNKNLLAYGGDIAVSGMGILNSLQSFLIMPIIGIRQGVQPIISYNFGARQFGRVKTASNQAMLLATAIISLGYLATRLFPRQLIGLFNQDPDLLDFGSRALTVWFMFMPIVGIQLLCANFFTAIGRPRSAMFLTLTRQVILLIPAVLIFPLIWGMAGLLYAAPFADFCSALLTGLWYVLTLRSLDRLAAAQAIVPQSH